MAEHSWQNFAARVDRTLGDGLERRVASHHRRRLAGLGWSEALAPGPGDWAAGSPPPRQGNSLELLVDGKTALPRVVEALRAARSQVAIADVHSGSVRCVAESGRLSLDLIEMTPIAEPTEGEMRRCAQRPRSRT